MASAKFQYRLKANAGGSVVDLQLGETEASLRYAYDGMGSKSQYTLELQHQPLTPHFGLLYVMRATGNLQFPNSESEFQSGELMLQYAILPSPAPFVQDDPGMDWFKANEQFDLILMIGRFTGSIFGIGVDTDSFPKSDLELLQALFELDKMMFERIAD